MPRIRSIRPDFFMDDSTACLHPDAQLLLIGLWTLADKDGRLEDRPRRIKAQVFPYREVDVDGHLSALDAAGAIQRYEAEGAQCIAICNWERDQRPHPKETSFDLPDPPVKCRETSRQGVDASRRVQVVGGSTSGNGSGSGSPRDADAPASSQGDLLTTPADKPPEKKAKKEASGPHAECFRALEAEYLRVMGHKYLSGNGTADATAVKWLLDGPGQAEGVRRWGRLLEWSKSGFPTVGGFQALRAHWNAAQVVGTIPPRKADKPSPLAQSDWSEYTIEGEEI